MKGIGHFLTGIAIASFFPEAMRGALDEKSLMLLLGGAFGILPDTLDFRIGRYLWKHHRIVTPDLNNLDARPVAAAVAESIDEAARTGKAVHLKLNTLKVSANYHRTYSVNVDDKAKTVTARIGPLKTMGQVMGGTGFLPRSLPDVPREQLEAVAAFKADAVNSYHADTQVAIFSGPDFAFVPDNGKVRVDFIPWHRTWAHAPLLGVFFGLLGLLVYGLVGMWQGAGPEAFVSSKALSAFGIMTLAFWGHTLVDQFGVLGSVLFWPFSSKRSAGFKFTHAASVMGNITLNYICVAIIVGNCLAYSSIDQIDSALPWASWLGLAGANGGRAYFAVGVLNYLLYFMAIPLALFYGAVKLWPKVFPGPTAEDTAKDEAAEGVDGPGELSGD